MGVYKNVNGTLKLIAGRGGGGGGGTDDYNDLVNQPQIAGITLEGNKTLAQLGIAAAANNPVSGDIASLDAGGNPVDSGWKTTALEAIVNVYGSKNLNAYPYDETTKVSQGITFTDVGDGTVIVSGLADANIYFTCHSASNATLYLKNGTYKVKVPVGSTDTGYWVQFAYTDTNNVTQRINLYEGNDEVTLNGTYGDADGGYVAIRLYVKSGTDLTTPITFEPMVRDARIKDSTFVPYAMTNRELTNKLGDCAQLSKTLAPVEKTKIASQAHGIGEWFIDPEGYLSTSVVTIAQGAELTLDTNYIRVSFADVNKHQAIYTAVHDGTKTYRQLLNEVYNNAYGSVSAVLRQNFQIMMNRRIYRQSYWYGVTQTFVGVRTTSSEFTVEEVQVVGNVNSCFYRKWNGSTVTDLSSQVAEYDVTLVMNY